MGTAAIAMHLGTGTVHGHSCYSNAPGYSALILIAVRNAPTYIHAGSYSAEQAIAS